MDGRLSTVSQTWRASARRTWPGDVARCLVTTPAAAEALPRLRRELMERNLPLSAGFWDSAEALLARIGAGHGR